MATNLNADAIINACRKVIEGTLGTTRVVATGQVLDQAQAGLTDEALGFRVRVKARYDIEVTSWRRTGAIASEMYNSSVSELGLNLKMWFTTEDELIESSKRATRASALELIEEARAALCFPGNLTTDGTTATGIISGCLMQSSEAKITREDWEQRIFAVEVPMRALVLVTHS